MLLLFTVSNGSRFQIGMVRGMKLFLYTDHFWHTFVCYPFHGGFFISFHGDYVGWQGDLNVAFYSLVE